MEMGVFTTGKKSMAQPGRMRGRSGWPVVGFVLLAMVLSRFQGAGPNHPSR
jgi:hypothetical protein